MAYNEELAQRVRDALYPLIDADEKKMFGGVAFMVRGNMAVGVQQDSLIVRVGLPKYQQALTRPGEDLFQPTSKPMAGWVLVSPQGHQSKDELNYWIKQALEFVETLPAK